ncbi:Nonribosomal peptide synthetase 12 [Mycena sanguinolenta]|uniref:Nonribosomal peptide synthetase 12 n=1 Tax=Mycena sanguinolenta TaxID=230812 RepID=A0A8H6X733_9AGAR|nr:Nonribosomal peptide synthetase 12 [Mycena sanguinolenta]
MTEVAVTFPNIPPPASDSVATSVHSRDVEKSPVNEVIKFNPAELELPAKLGRSSFTRWLHHIAFSYYRKTFTLIFVANLVAFIIFVVQKDGHPLAPNVGSAASANLMVTLLFRQENFVNLAYEIAVACPHSAPLWLRRRLAKVFHYGGAHSGAGVAAVVWYIMYTAVTTRDYIADPSNWGLANLATSYILVTMFIFILAAAHPVLRRRYHDYFEAQTNTVSSKWGRRPWGRYLISTPNFWTLCISTSCSILSWGRLRRHDVYPEVLSSHAIRLHFKYRDMDPFYGLKVSTKPLLEWHAFATIPDDDGSGPKGFSFVVSNAGDWTRECIANPPKKLWVRGYPMHGLLYTSKMFKKIVVVATGSGIGPCLSLFYADVTPRRIFWSTPSPLVTYGDKIMAAVKKADPDAWIWDTRKDGRPDMVAITYQLVVEAQAEAVYIISNPKLTRRVVYGMESRGIAAYGAIFDS